MGESMEYGVWTMDSMDCMDNMDHGQKRFADYGEDYGKTYIPSISGIFP
jgi:hypothetical protein